MASYEVEHNIPSAPPAATNSGSSQPPPPRRPDLSTFFATLELVDTSSTTNTHALPIPSDVSAVFRSLAEVFQQMSANGSGGSGERQEGEWPVTNGFGFMAGLIDDLMRDAEMPPEKVRGVSEEWLADLERIPKKKLKPGDVCPICNNAFLDDPYPLVIRLPCHPSHIFDLECIQPWLKLHPTCPLDRKDLLEKEKIEDVRREREERAGEEEEEGEWDGMYA